MKILKNILFLSVMVFGFTTCDMTDLDLQDDPNAVSPDQASINDLYNNIQLDFNDFYSGTWGVGGLARMVNLTGGFTYNDVFSPTSFNFVWGEAYAVLFPDIDALIALDAEGGFGTHTASAKIMKAYAMCALVDMFGDIPYSEIGQGTDIISPNRDDGASVYAAADALLTEAIATLESADVFSPVASDIYYGGDRGKWAALAKTLQLRNAVVTKLAGGSGGTVTKIVNDGDFISSTDGDFQFQYGTNRDNPNSRHWMYNDAYENSDATYMSNYYMWLMAEEKVDAGDNFVVDPRIRFYFYRQVASSIVDNDNVYSCIHTDRPDEPEDFLPAHYAAVDPNLPYCVATENGYYGRDHMNGSGIPPDGPIRTVWGVYPAGGLFDDNSFILTQNGGTDGGLGGGIAPIMLASYVDFMRAEAALTMGTGEDAKQLMMDGIQKSIDKVISSKSLVPGQMSRIFNHPVLGEISVEAFYVDSTARNGIQPYMDYVSAEFDAADADEQLSIVMREYMIALWGNGLEAYNNYRRTGKPNRIAPTTDANSGTFLYSAWYPSDHVNLNANAVQKDNQVINKVFWDTNGDICY